MVRFLLRFLRISGLNPSYYVVFFAVSRVAFVAFIQRFPCHADGVKKLLVFQTYISPRPLNKSRHEDLNKTFVAASLKIRVLLKNKLIDLTVIHVCSVQRIRRDKD